MKKLSELKREYLEHLEIERGRSLHTVGNYERYLSRFLSFLGKENPGDISDEAVREYRLWLNRQKAPSPHKKDETLKRKTQNYYLIALRGFLKYLRKRGIDSFPPERIELAKLAERSIDLI